MSVIALNDRISLEMGRLIIDTPKVVRLATLGGYRRTITVDPELSSFAFKTRILFKSKKRIVFFSEISRLDYSYSDTIFHGKGMRQPDLPGRFTLGLVLINREEITIGKFLAEGALEYGLECILAGDNVFEYRGGQEEQSLALLKLLQTMTGLPLT